MEFGFAAPAYSPIARPDRLTTLARRGEQMGFSVLRIGDHVVIPNRIDSHYPGTVTGGFPGAKSGEWLDSLTVLGFLAGQTSTIRLLTSVIVLPLRGPVLTAKILATIDVLSKGRLIVGCGVGWMREEFEALGAPPFEERGAVGNEYIRVCKELWTSDTPSFEGKYCRFSDISFLPKPLQKPHPPIWVGGCSPAAMRRAARLGDAWYPTGDNPRYPLGTLEQLSKGISRLHRYVEKAGRDPSRVGVVYNAGWHKDREPESTSGGERRIFTGSPEQIAGDIRACRELGVGQLMLNFERDTLEGMLEDMERFAAVVMPLANRDSR